MLKVALTTLSIVIATGAAFAGSDHFDPGSMPTATVDHSTTASVPKPRKDVDTSIKTGAPGKAKIEPMDFGHDLWGN
ncbi:MAG TPA: DUF680 domain-containing protein [Mesorhizobium sp.]|jgi:hypothetical protein|uniref:DUF680 domain-containing protein n=1 Tax=Mesorhizobium sp. TaxID=1871066 RepID=UPI002DDD56E2|nr:DUF680 domain-containing protein [Mesorhizobium sp.]HEV2507780.1 DUF680 domain-containing protein [Mesorhizobium sp.]